MAPTVQPDLRRVLVYRLGSLGDTLVALPCFHLIERCFPRAERRLLTNFPAHAKAPAAAAVLGDSGLIHGYMRYTVGTRNPLELLRLAREIRSFKPDAMIYVMPSRTPSQVTRDERFFRYLCGVRRIIGLPPALDSSTQQPADPHGQSTSQLTHPSAGRVFDPATGRYEAEAVRLARNLAALGDANPADIHNWNLRLTSSELSKATEVLAPLGDRPLIAVGPGTKMQAKDWGRERWRALLDQLRLRYPAHGLVLIGAREDSEVSQFAADGWQGNAINLCGLISPRETAAVLARAQVFIGPDSGPMHLAAAVGTPCVIAFSARGLPGVWYPVGPQHEIIYHQVSCFGCNLETCLVENRRCLEAITVDQMAAAVARILARTA